MISVTDNAELGRYEIHQDGEVAYAEYRKLASGTLFPHTEVPEALEGRGLGAALVRHAMMVLRKEGGLALPVCTFFAGYIARHPEYHDLVHPDYRAALGI